MGGWLGNVFQIGLRSSYGFVSQETCVSCLFETTVLEVLLFGFLESRGKDHMLFVSGQIVALP